MLTVLKHALGAAICALLSALILGFLFDAKEMDVWQFRARAAPRVGCGPGRKPPRQKNSHRYRRLAHVRYRPGLPPAHARAAVLWRPGPAGELSLHFQKRHQAG